MTDALVPYRPMNLDFWWPDHQPFSSLARFDGLSWPALFPGYAPAVDVLEDGDAFVVRAELPGYGPEDIEIELEGNELAITAQRRSEAHGEGGDHRYKAYRCHRVLVLPGTVDIDGASANMEHGLLTIRLPRGRAQSLTRRIWPRNRKTSDGEQGRSGRWKGLVEPVRRLLRR